MRANLVIGKHLLVISVMLGKEEFERFLRLVHMSSSTANKYIEEYKKYWHEEEEKNGTT